MVLCDFFEIGPVSQHPLVSADGKQGGVQVSRESPFTQGQVLHFSGNVLVSLLKSEKHRLILTQSMETKDIQEEIAFSLQLTSIMAFITRPAPFTMAIDGCYRKEPLKTLTVHHDVMLLRQPPRRAEINYLEEFEQCATV